MIWRLRSSNQAAESARVPLWVSAADVVTAALLCLALTSLIVPVRITAIGLTTRRWWRPLLGAVAIAAVRHALVRNPSLRTRAATLWRSSQTRWPALTFAVPVALAIRIAVVLVGYVGAVTIPFPADAPFTSSRLQAWWDLPRRWDAGWYISVARNGYQWSGDLEGSRPWNFFPAYPYLLRFVASLCRLERTSSEAAFAWTATLVSVVTFVVAAVWLYKLVEEQFGRPVASKAVLLLSSYPFAIFYGAVYSEALFLFGVVTSWYYCRQNRVGLTFVCGLISGLARPNGALLAFPLLLVARRRPLSIASTAAALSPLLGVAIYSAYAYHVTGHPFIWIETQREAFGRTYMPLTNTVGLELRVLAEGGLIQYLGAWPWRALNLAATILSLVAIWPIARRVGLAEAVFVALNTLVPLLNGGFVSMGRYTSTMFPIFIWLALTCNGASLPVLVCLFGIGQSLVAIGFFTWRNIF